MMCTYVSYKGLHILFERLKHIHQKVYKVRYDWFHRNSYTPKIHKVQNLKFLVKKFTLNQNLISNLYREIPRNLNFLIWWDFGDVAFLVETVVRCTQRCICPTHAYTHLKHTYTHTQDTQGGYDKMYTGWQSCIGYLKWQVSFCKRATNYRALVWKTSCKDKSPYASLRHLVSSLNKSNLNKSIWHTCLSNTMLPIYMTYMLIK